MDDLTAKITGILNDPNGMEKIKQMAQGMLGDSTHTTEHKEEGLAPDFNVEQMAGMMKIASLLGSKGKDDETTVLLKALKPHLSKERCEKVDKAISLMRVVKLLPMLKENGLLNLLGG